MAAYPTLPIKCNIKPSDSNSRNLSVDQAGGIHAVDLGAKTAYQIEVVHPLLESADRQTALDFYEANRNLVSQFTYNGAVYDVVYMSDYAEEFVSPTRTTLKVNLMGNRQ